MENLRTQLIGKGETRIYGKVRRMDRREAYGLGSDYEVASNRKGHSVKNGCNQGRLKPPLPYSILFQQWTLSLELKLNDFFGGIRR